jgi:predicted nucleic acid-binding protein
VILVDTAVWIDHLRAGDAELGALLEHGAVLAHPWVTGELALGHMRGRVEILLLLDDLPQATVATPGELLAFIDHHELLGLGIGYVDAQLLASTMLTDDATLWTRDRRLQTAAERLGAAYAPTLPS